MLKKYVILLLTVSIFLAQKTTAMERERANTSELPPLSPASRLVAPQDLEADNLPEQKSPGKMSYKELRKERTILLALLQAKEQELEAKGALLEQQLVYITLKDDEALGSRRQITDGTRTATQLLRNRNDRIAQLEADLAQALAALPRPVAPLVAPRIIVPNECVQAQNQLEQSLPQHLLKVRNEVGGPIRQSELSPVQLALIKQNINDLNHATAFREDRFKGPAFAEFFDLMQKAAVGSYFNIRPELFKVYLAKLLSQSTDAIYGSTHLCLTILLGDEKVEVLRNLHREETRRKQLEDDLAEARKQEKISDGAYRAYKKDCDKLKQLLQKVYDESKKHQAYQYQDRGAAFLVNNIPLLGALNANDDYATAGRKFGEIADLAKKGL